MTGQLLLALCALVVAASALPNGFLPRELKKVWVKDSPSTETPYTKPTDIPSTMPRSCEERPDKNDYLMIVSPLTCTRFIVCNDERQWDMACPAGLFFNYKKQYCDWPELSGCDEREKPGLPTTAFVTVTPPAEEATTPAPDTPAPDTPAPDTPAPDTPAPDTPAPDTPAPDTPAPDTPAPDTPAPDTPAPDTPAPDTPAPDTPAPERATTYLMQFRN